MSRQSERDLLKCTENNEVKIIDRRALLKKMLITSGVVVTSQFIPGEWMKPVIGIGTLPAHAQGSIVEPSSAESAPLTSENIVGSWAISGNDNGEVFSSTMDINTGGTGQLYSDDVVGGEAITWTFNGTILSFGGATNGTGPISGNSNAFTMIDQDGTIISFTRIS